MIFIGDLEMITIIFDEMIINGFDKSRTLEGRYNRQRLYFAGWKANLHKKIRTQVGRVQKNPRRVVQRTKEKIEKSVALAKKMREIILFFAGAYNAECGSPKTRNI